MLAAVASLAGLPAHAQTDVSASLYGAFSGRTAAPGTPNASGGALLIPSNAAGALIEVRHIRNPLVGYEATYAYNRANQSEFVNSNTPPAMSSWQDASTSTLWRRSRPMHTRLPESGSHP